MQRRRSIGIGSPIAEAPSHITSLRPEATASHAGLTDRVFGDSAVSTSGGYPRSNKPSFCVKWQVVVRPKKLKTNKPQKGLDAVIPWLYRVDHEDSNINTRHDLFSRGSICSPPQDVPERTFRCRGR